MLEPRDDLRHTLRPGPHSRESLFYGAVLPEERLMVFLYTWVDADDLAGGMLVVAGTEAEPLVLQPFDGVPAEGQDFDDWTVQGLSVRHRELLQVAELGFAGDGVSFEGTFTASHPAFAYSQNADGCPQYAADDRFEQGGRLVGTLRFGDREVAVDAFGHRDHSWGTRDWATIQDWKWLQAQNDEVQLNLMVMHGRGRTHQNGYVVKGGVLEAITDVRAEVDYDVDWRQRAADIRIQDAAGRQTRVQGERVTYFQFTAGGRSSLREGGFAGQIDGTPAVFHLECGWDAEYAERQAATERAAAGVA